MFRERTWSTRDAIVRVIVLENKIIHMHHFGYPAGGAHRFPSSSKSMRRKDQVSASSPALPAAFPKIDY